MRRTVLSLLLLGALAGAAQARPAPWYWWSGDGEARVCAQTSPGRGWVREAQPFKDARCSIRL